MKFLAHVLARVLLPVAILAAGGYGYAVLSVQPEPEAIEPPPEQVLRSRASSLSVCDYPVRIETHGVVGAHNQVTLSAEVTGVIRSTESAFEAGAFFEKGELLLEIDNRDYRTALKVAQEQHELAKANLKIAQNAHSRMQELARQRSASTSEVDGTFASLVQAESEVEITASSIEIAQRNLEKTRIYAPFDGRVVSKTVGVGQLVSAGTTLGEVFAVDFAEVRLPISSRDLRHLELPEMEGDPAVDVELRDAIDSTRGAVWRGKIVRTEGTLDADSLELFAIARVEDPFGLRTENPVLRIGQPVTATIYGETLHDIVVIPRKAVRRLDQVYLIDEDKLTLRSLTIDPLWSDSQNVVVSGHSILDNELLATTMLVYAPEGSPVEIIPEERPASSLAGEPPELDTTP
ncbi:efflux RND transporter periplasmic adaptor subunit [Rhodopirellula sallentina]|uniref:Membrane-fusion protein n=1 Tax=Rhodopirellula sallentina SM41 TaxID=1263870 RepID=M5UKF1_9BACT|nr:efflux RND transporter periplasmic adaptor subunit [Rhodopirellula sallentina]EMI58331.1 Membrane-fusion protein [Rhodopirellula sallentina SM41]